MANKLRSLTSDLDVALEISLREAQEATINKIIELLKQLQSSGKKQ